MLQVWIGLTYVNLLCRYEKLEFSNLRKTLHPVHGTRSPGGTILKDNAINDTGNGVTPMLARALKRKFEVCGTKNFTTTYLFSAVSPSH